MEVTIIIDRTHFQKESLNKTWHVSVRYITIEMVQIEYFSLFAVVHSRASL